MNVSLTEGALEAIVKGDPCHSPLFQIICSKMIPSECGGGRYRLILSDGRNSYSSVMLVTQLNEKMRSGEMDDLCVIMVKQYICNTLENRRVMILLDVEVVAKGSEVNSRIGNPQPLVLEQAPPQPAPCSNGVPICMASRAPTQPTPSSNGVPICMANRAPTKPTPSSNEVQNCIANTAAGGYPILGNPSENQEFGRRRPVTKKRRTYSLTEGAIEAIVEGNPCHSPLLQIISSKLISCGTGIDRFRILLSDGRNTYSHVMLATQLNEMMQSGELDNHCVIKVKQYICNTLQGNRRVMILLEVEVVAKGSEVNSRIGNPQPLVLEQAPPQPAPSSTGEQNDTATTAAAVTTANQRPMPAKMTHISNFSHPNHIITPQTLQLYTSHGHPMQMQGSAGQQFFSVPQQFSVPTSLTHSMQTHTHQSPHTRPQIVIMPLPGPINNPHIHSQFQGHPVQGHLGLRISSESPEFGTRRHNVQEEMTSILTEGAIEAIVADKPCDSPLLQIISSKLISSGTGSDRYRLLLSDGRNTYSHVMLATQLNGMMQSGELDNNCVIWVKQYICNTLQGNRRVMILLDVEVVAKGSEVKSRIGNPQPLVQEQAPPQPAPSSNGVPICMVNRVPPQPAPSSDTSPNSTESSVAAGVFSIEEKYRQLKDQKLCKICLERDVEITFTPCGHFVACEQCGQPMKKCPICRQPIKSYVKTYMS